MLRGFRPANLGRPDHILERETGIERNPQTTAWEAATLPLSYSRFDPNYTAEKPGSIEGLAQSQGNRI
jgi:hypothetical protein